MKYIAIALSEVGKIRQNNEDNLFFDGAFRDSAESSSSFRKTLSSQDPVKLFALCDGMGGEVMGEEASYMAVSGLKEIEHHFVKDLGKSFPKLMPRYLARVNESMCQTIRNNKGRRMGSTFASLILKGNVAQALNVGDSRIYLFRNGKLNQLSVDHTYAQRLVEMGIISQAEAAQHPERNRLSQHLGMFPEEAKIEPALSPEIWLQAGDCFLICTDGITEMVSEESITEILRSPQAFLQQAENLMQRALAAGGKDNISLILVKIQELDEGDDEDFAALSALQTNQKTEAADEAAMEQAVSSFREINPESAPTIVMNLSNEAAEDIAVTRPLPQADASVPLGSVVERLAEQSDGVNPLESGRKANIVSKSSGYQLSEDEVARFEAARQAALERQQALKATGVQNVLTNEGSTVGRTGQALQKAGAQSAADDPRNRKLRGPSTGHIIGRAIMVFLIFLLIGAALIFFMMNIDLVIRLIRRIFG